MKSLILFMSLFSVSLFAGNVGGNGAPYKPISNDQNIFTSPKAGFGNVGGGGRSLTSSSTDNSGIREITLSYEGGNVGGN